MAVFCGPVNLRERGAERLPDRISGAELVARYTWSAMGWLAEHELISENYWKNGSGAQWEIGRPGTFVHRCEILAGIGGSLIVHGDFDLVRFAHSDQRNAWRRLLWLADHQSGRYIAEKACIGMGGEKVSKYDERVALYDLQEEIDERDATDPDPKLIEVLKEAREHVETEHQLREFLSDRDEGWDLWEREYGCVVRPEVVTQWCALNKCAWLLREKYGDDGPPQCRPGGGGSTA